MIDDDEMKHRRLVELNVIEQCLNVYKTGVVQRRRKGFAEKGEAAYPKIHAMVFDPKVGRLNRLPVNFKKAIAQFKDIYNLY
jgi:carbonic anhydrase